MFEIDNFIYLCLKYRNNDVKNELLFIRMLHLF